MIEQFILLLFLALFNACLIVFIHRASFFSWHPDAIAALDYLPEDSDSRGILKHSKGVLWWLGYFAQTRLGDFWSKPVCMCTMCMASLWSVPMYWGYHFVYTIPDAALWYGPYMTVLSVLSMKIDNSLQ